MSGAVTAPKAEPEVGGEREEEGDREGWAKWGQIGMSVHRSRLKNRSTEAAARMASAPA
jgi:hypothetical protein